MQSLNAPPKRPHGLKTKVRVPNDLLLEVLT